MAGIRITYSYRKFHISRLATFVDYVTHNPVTSTFLGFFLSSPVLLLGCSLITLCEDTIFLKYIALIVALAGFLLFLLSGYFVALLSDKLDFAGHIARKKREKLWQPMTEAGKHV